MIPRIHKRGSSTIGLLHYLYGPGTHEEHIDPHLVASLDGNAPDPGRDPTATYKQLQRTCSTSPSTPCPTRTSAPTSTCGTVRAQRPRGPRSCPTRSGRDIARRMVAAAGIDDPTARAPAAAGLPSGTPTTTSTSSPPSSARTAAAPTTTDAGRAQAEGPPHRSRVRPAPRHRRRRHRRQAADQRRTPQGRTPGPGAHRARGTARDRTPGGRRRDQRGGVLRPAGRRRPPDPQARRPLRRPARLQGRAARRPQQGRRSPSSTPAPPRPRPVPAPHPGALGRRRRPEHRDVRRTRGPAPLERPGDRLGGGRPSAVWQAVLVVDDGEDAAVAAHIAAAGEVLDALAKTSAAHTRHELREAAFAFERASRSHIRAERGHDRALRQAARDLVHSGPALGRGEDGATTAMAIDMVFFLVTAAAHWHAKKGPRPAGRRRPPGRRAPARRLPGRRRTTPWRAVPARPASVPARCARGRPLTCARRCRSWPSRSWPSRAGTRWPPPSPTPRPPATTRPRSWPTRRSGGSWTRRTRSATSWCGGCGGWPICPPTPPRCLNAPPPRPRATITPLRLRRVEAINPAGRADSAHTPSPSAKVKAGGQGLGGGTSASANVFSRSASTSPEGAGDDQRNRCGESTQPVPSRNTKPVPSRNTTAVPNRNRNCGAFPE